MGILKKQLMSLVAAGAVILVCAGCGDGNHTDTLENTNVVSQSGEEVSGKEKKVWEGAILYEREIDWQVTQRTAEYELDPKTELSDLFELTLTLQFPEAVDEENGHNTLFLVADGQKIAGLQNTADNRITVWTKWKGTAEGKTSGDRGAFGESAVLVSDYDKSMLEVVFAINRSQKKLIVSCADRNFVLPLDEELAFQSIDGFAFANYNTQPSVIVKKVLIREADPDYTVICGQGSFAKVVGSRVEKTYTLGQLNESGSPTFRWGVLTADTESNAGKNTASDTGATPEGLSVTDGILTVLDTVKPGKYRITAVCDGNEDRQALLEILIDDYQKIETENARIDGPAVLAKGAVGAFAVSELIDSYGDDVTGLFPAAQWISDDESVVKVTDQKTGEVTAVSDGETVISAVIDNGGVRSTFSTKVTVGSKFCAVGEADGEETAVDVSGVILTGDISGWQVTTAKDGILVSSVFCDDSPGIINTKGADSYEIAPVYVYEGVLGNLGEGGYQFDLADGAYHFVIRNISGSRRDVYVNNQMLVNNFLQDGGKPNSIQVNDIVIKGGKAVVSLDDYSGSVSTRIEVYKAPSILERTRKIYVAGDSLVCMYYNGANASNNQKTGFGQVLQDYIKGAEVVDLGNSGQTAEGLITTAFTQIFESACVGDLVLFEAGYNDRNYSTEEKMKEALKEAVEKCRKIGAKLIFVSPNASPHDYKDTVSWTKFMEDVVKETGADYIDLGEVSYQFLYDTYGDSTDVIAKTYVVNDKLHSTFNGANKWASLIAGKLADLGFEELVDFDYQFTFRDALKNDIVCAAQRTAESRSGEAENPVGSYAFYFASGTAPEGFRRFEDVDYSEERGFGFSSTRAFTVSAEGITSERNFRFKLTVPNGNYTVTVETTAEKIVSETVESVTAQTGIEKTGNTFEVAVCDGLLDLTFPANTFAKSVRIDPAEEKLQREKPFIFAIGDSTTKNTADGAKSWGNVAADGEVELPAVFGGFENHGMAGRDSVNYYNQGRLEAVLLAVCPGDYVTVNMGINSKETGEQKAYYTLMKEYYVQGLLQRGAIPVIVTATPDGPVGGNVSGDYDANTGKFKNNRGDGARNNVLRQIAGELNLNLIELGQWGEDWMNSLTMEDVTAYNKEYGTSFATVLEMVQSFYVDHNHYKQYLGIQIARFLFGELEKLAE